mgnify:CR=1 FL=1
MGGRLAFMIFVGSYLSPGMNKTILTRHPLLVAAVGYVCLHVALVIGSTAYARSDTGSLVATGFSSIAYYLLITAFGAVILAVITPSLPRQWWVAGGMFSVTLVAIRYTFAPAAGILTIVAVLAFVFLPYAVGVGAVVRLLARRFGGDRSRSLPDHPITRRGLFVAGVFLIATVGGSVLAVATAPPAVPPEDWPVDQQFDYLERTDQHDRETGAVADRSRDFRRADRVLSLLAAGRADAPEEWLDAAVVLHHGTCPAHFELAHGLALAANESGKVSATEWVYLTYDRWQVSIGESQRYGTQTGTRSVDAACHPPVPSGLDPSTPLGAREGPSPESVVL